MKQISFTLFHLFFSLTVIAQVEWSGFLHGTQFEYGDEFGSCEGSNPFEDYAYSDVDADYCVSVTGLGLPDERTSAIYINPEGDVYIGTYSGFSIHRANQLVESYNFRTSTLPGPAPVEAIYEDSEGVIWVSAQGQGVFALFPDEGWRKYPMMIGSPFPGTARAFVEDYLGDIWSCGSFGVGHYDRDEDSWTLYHHTNSAIPIGEYNDLVFDENFDIWLAHQWDGLMFFKPGVQELTKYNTGNSEIASDFISALHFQEDEFLTDNKIWYGAADNGFGYFHIQDGTWTHWAASDYPDWLNGQVLDITFEANEEVIWLATLAGIARFKDNSFTSYSPGLGNYHALQNQKIAVDTTTGQVWALSNEDGPGIHYPWEATGRLTRFNNGALNSNAFRKVAIAPNGEPWVAGRDNPGVLAMYRGGRLRNVSFATQGLSYTINDLTFSGDFGYVATDDGFWQFDYRLLNQFTHYTNDNQIDVVNAIETAPDGTIWICTENGLFHFDGTGFTEYNSFNSGLPDGEVTHIAFEPEGAAWIGTKIGGVVRFDGNTTWDNYLSTSNGLPSNQIWEVSYDLMEERVYIATEQGLVHWKESEGTPFVYPAMSTSPLGSRFRSVTVDADGRLYAGSLIGFGVYDAGNGWQVYDETNSPLADKPVNDITIDRDGNKWLVGLSSTAGGLYRFNDGGPGVIPQQYHMIRGNVFNDNNQNGQYESQAGETPRANLVIKLTRESDGVSEYTSTNIAGDYEFILTTSDTYSVKLIEPQDAYALNGSDISSYVLDFNPDLPNPDTLPSVGLVKQIQGMSFLDVAVTPAKMRCNEEVAVHLRIRNLGSESISNPKYELEYDNDALTFNYSDAHLDAFSLFGRVAWEGATELAPNETIHLSAYFSGPAEALTGTELCFNGIGEYAEGADVVSQMTTTCDVVYCGVDPNDKLVEPVGNGPEHATHPDSVLTYTVRFQNTGNDYAHNVSILDTLDPNLDIETFQIIATSHDFLMDVLPGNVLGFTFPGIMLPDSSTNPLGSQGFVKYEIEALEDVAENTVISNTAYIYFDQNAPIQTNTVFNTMDRMSTSIINSSGALPSVRLYPNPSTDFVQLEFSNTYSSIQIEVFDLLGQCMFVYSGAVGNTYQLQRQEWPAGLYTIRVQGKDLEYSEKVVFK